VLLAVSFLPSAHAHAYISTPISRNKLANTDCALNPGGACNYEPQSLAAGGPATVGALGAVWPNGYHGMCGDAYSGPQNHAVNGAMYRGTVVGERYAETCCCCCCCCCFLSDLISSFSILSVFSSVLRLTCLCAANYTEGGVMRMDVTFTAFHKGRIVSRICKVANDNAAEAAGLTESCLDQNILVQSPAGAQPGWSIWYLPVDGISTTYTTYYNLPADLHCGADVDNSRCILQMWWTTGERSFTVLLFPSTVYLPCFQFY
jgi:hypothetical protein